MHVWEITKKWGKRCRKITMKNMSQLYRICFSNIKSWGQRRVKKCKENVI